MRKNNTKVILPLFISIVTPLALLINSGIYRSAVSEALYSCANVLIPSLFPFFVLSSFTVFTDSINPLTRRMGIISKAFAIPTEGISAVILSLIGGYPVGAKAASTLYSEGRLTGKQAEKLVYCCVGAGPGFLITFLGEGLLGCKQAGFELLVSDILSILSLLTLYRSKDKDTVAAPSKRKVCSLGEAVVFSTEQAVHTSLFMCGSVALFTVINKLMELLPYYSGAMAAALEITCGTIRSTGKIPMELTAFFIGFGGICVHFQIFGIAENIKVSKIRFTAFRLAQGLLSAGYMYLIMFFFPISKDTFYNVAQRIQPALSGTSWGAGALIILSIIFLISIGHNKKQEVNLCAE